MYRAMLVLERCLAADREIAELQFAYETETELATAVGGHPEAGGDRKAAGTHSERVATGACEMARQKEALDARVARKSAEVIAVSRMLKRLTLTQAKVARMYYIKRYPLGAVAKALGYSYGYIRNIRIDAAARIGKISDDDITAMMPPEYPFTLTEQEIAARERDLK